MSRRDGTLPMVRTMLSWIATIPFLLCFGLALVVFDVIGRIALLFGLRPFENVMAALQRVLASLYLICGTRITVERHPDLKPNTGYAIIGNHQGLLDIVLIGGHLFSNYPKYVAKAELGRWIPSIALNLKKGGNALIDRNDRVQSVRAITRMAREAQERNVSVVIFPEGTRSPDGRLQPFKRAGSEALLKAADRLPVVPAAIDGSWRLSRMFPVAFGARVRMRFGPPIDRTEGDAARVLDQAHAFISNSLREWATAPV